MILWPPASEETDEPTMHTGDALCDPHSWPAVLGVNDTLLVRRITALLALLPALYDGYSEDDYLPLKRRCGIAPTSILALPWHPARLADARRQLHLGRKAPLVRVTRYRVGRRCWYIPTDGIHRSWAARELGKARIGALIDGEIVCRPEQYLLRKQHATWTIWQRLSEGHTRFVMVVAPDWLDMALELGVCDARASVLRGGNHGEPAWT
jgi:hypothetical protein